MNKLEKSFYNYLIAQKINKDEIKFFKKDSPDFLVNNIGYEIKRKNGKSKKFH